MINLVNGTGDLLKVNTDASADIEAHASWIDYDAAGVATRGGDAVASFTGTGDNTIVTGASSTKREIKHISLRNNHASQACVCIVSHNDGSQTASMIQATLLAGESLVYNQAGSWTHFDSNSGIYAGLPVASQADQESGSSLLAFVTPGRQHFHPSAAKCWGKATVAAAVPTMVGSYNMTSITDTATDQITITIANDFSGTTYTFIPAIEAATTSLSATTTSLFAFIRNATQAAGSAIIQSCEIDIGAATDPAAWHWVGFGDL